MKFFRERKSWVGDMICEWMLMLLLWEFGGGGGGGGPGGGGGGGGGGGPGGSAVWANRLPPLARSGFTEDDEDEVDEADDDDDEEDEEEDDDVMEDFSKFCGLLALIGSLWLLASSCGPPLLLTTVVTVVNGWMLLIVVVVLSSVFTLRAAKYRFCLFTLSEQLLSKNNFCSCARRYESLRCIDAGLTSIVCRF